MLGRCVETHCLHQQGGTISGGRKKAAWATQFDPEGGGSAFLRNIDGILLDYTASHSRLFLVTAVNVSNPTYVCVVQKQQETEVPEGSHPKQNIEYHENIADFAVGKFPKCFMRTITSLPRGLP
jgi:hypothetical protein